MELVHHFFSFHGDQPDAKQSSMMKMWNMFSGKLSGSSESVYMLSLGVGYVCSQENKSSYEVALGAIRAVIASLYDVLCMYIHSGSSLPSVTILCIAPLLHVALPG